MIKTSGFKYGLLTGRSKVKDPEECFSSSLHPAMVDTASAAEQISAS